jgi:hypothetical protein
MRQLYASDSKRVPTNGNAARNECVRHDLVRAYITIWSVCIMVNVRLTKARRIAQGRALEKQGEK